MKPQSPCKECEGRRPGCHSDCEGYAEYCKVLEAWKQVVRAEKYEGIEADSYRIETLIKIKKIRQGGKV